MQVNARSKVRFNGRKSAVYGVRALFLENSFNNAVWKRNTVPKLLSQFFLSRLDLAIIYHPCLPSLSLRRTVPANKADTLVSATRQLRLNASASAAQFLSIPTDPA